MSVKVETEEIPKPPTPRVLTVLDVGKAVNKKAFQIFTRKARKYHSKGDLIRLWNRSVEQAGQIVQKKLTLVLERQRVAKACEDARTPASAAETE